MVGQLSAAFLMPFVGAAVDYTDSRRFFGSASAWILAVTTLLQAVISRRTWQLVACLHDHRDAINSEGFDRHLHLHLVSSLLLSPDGTTQDPTG